jgi:hypothetical protein
LLLTPRRGWRFVFCLEECLRVVYLGKIEVIKGTEVWRNVYARKAAQWLREQGYVQAREYQYRPNSYALTPKGEALLEQEEMYRGVEKSGNSYEEEIGMCVTFASFVLGMKKYGARLIVHNEIADPPYEFPVDFPYRKPDGKTVHVHRVIRHDWRPFGIELETPDGYLVMFIPGMERDMGTQSQEKGQYTKTTLQHHLRGTLRASKGGLYKRKLGIDNFWIPFVLTESGRVKKAIKNTLDYTDGRGAQNILFGILPKYESREKYPLPGPWAFEMQWQRAGHSESCPMKRDTKIKCSGCLEPFSFAEAFELK